MNLTRQAELYIQLLKEVGADIDRSLDQFQTRLAAYAGTRSLENRIDLEASIAHFEKYLLPIVRLRLATAEPHSDDRGQMTLGISGHWRAYEFRQLFESVDYLNKLITIRFKLHRSAPDFRLEREMTRSVVYRQARLYYYLALSEEIRVTSVTFSSPGAISFEGIASIVHELRELVDYFLTCRWLRGLVDTYDHLKYERPAKINEAKARSIEAESRLKIALRNLQHSKLQGNAIEDLESMHRALKLLNDIADLTVELDSKGFARLDKVEDALVHAIANLQRLGSEQKKVAVVGAKG